MLEEIRFLLNYRMDSENPLALILSGQSELWDRMKTQAYRAIRYRIDVECFMELFDCSQTEAYIAKQLHYAGGNEQIFSDSALKKIYDYSKMAFPSCFAKNDLPRKSSSQLFIGRSVL